MKNLRHLLGSYRKTGNKSRSNRVRRSDVTKRQLSTEMLERRELLAAGILQSQNSWNQFDVNNDQAITARDALGVINYLGRGESEQVSTSSDRMFYDVNGDDAITAADALSVINAIGRGEGMEEQLIELLLTARRYDADPGVSTDGFDLDLIGPDSEVSTNGIGQTTRTVPDANQVIEVDVNEIFELEVSYEDLRSFPNRLGAFQLITNIVADQQGFLQPVLFETQQLVVDQSIRDVPADDQAGTSVTLSIPNSPPGVIGNLTYEASWADFSANAPTQVRLALFEFGYSTDQYELSIPEGVDPDDIAFQIHWTDIAFADADLPNIQIEVNEVAGAADIPASEEAFDPTVLVNGTPQFNPAAIPFNLNTESRSFDDNEPFYTANNDGDFDPATGFRGIKGIGGVPSQGGGIPQLLNELEYPAGPFDFISLPVRIVAPVTGLQISVEPNSDNGAQTEAILVYGEDERLPITNDTVIIEGANDVDMNSNGKATIIISAVDDSNSPPVVSQAITETFTEDDGTESVDLRQFASDPDVGDILSVINPVITNDPNNAVTVTGNSASVVTGAYGALNDNDSQVITVSYTISDGNGGTVAQTATITITGVTDFVNSDPTATPLSQSFDEGAAVATVDLLANAMDVDQGQTLNVVGLVRTSGNAVGITEGANSLSVDPGDYGFLLPGQSEVIVYTYDVIDGNGGSVTTSATVTINGTVDDAPSAGTVDDVTTQKDSGPVTIDVLSAATPGAGETQPLSIVNATLENSAAGTVTFNGTLVFTPAAGFEGDTTINYAVGDGTSTDDGTVAVSVVDFVPSTIGGDVFIDRIENMPDVIDGATPFRDGTKDPNEQGLGGVPIKLMGNGMEWMAYTDLSGSYEFENVAPGTYQVMYDQPDNVIYFGPSTMSITIGAAGGVTDVDNNFALIGLTPSATSGTDILARTYLNANNTIAAISNGGREGVIVSLGEGGESNFIMAGEGFGGVRFADVQSISGSDTDAALLTVLTEDGDVKSALIPHDRAILSSDGSTMRFFGGMDDFPFVNRSSNVTSFDDFQSAIDQILSDDE